MPVKRAKAVRACVAYWTVAPDFVDELLAKRLSGSDGFLCVDYHLPTDIDQLARLVDRGAAVHLLQFQAGFLFIPTSPRRIGSSL